MPAPSPRGRRRAEDAADLERRKRHVIDLVLHGLRGPRAPGRLTLTEPSTHD